MGQEQATASLKWYLFMQTRTSKANRRAMSRSLWYSSAPRLLCCYCCCCCCPRDDSNLHCQWCSTSVKRGSQNLSMRTAIWGSTARSTKRSGVDGPSIRSSVAKQSGYSLTLRSSNEMLGIALVSRSVGDFGLHPALRGHCRRLRRRKSSWQIANVTSFQCRGFGHLPRSGQSSEICAHQNFQKR